MKLRRIFSLGLAMSIAVPAFAQVDSASSFCPMNVGDIWQYHYHYKQPWMTDSVSSYFFVSVVADTLMPNGKHYMQFDKVVDGFSTIRRVDSSSGCVYEYSDFPAPSEILIDSLRAKEGDQFMCHGGVVSCLSIETLTVLGVETIAKEFELGFNPPQNNIFAFGLGIVRHVYYDIWGYVPYPMYTDLVYSKINGREDGTIVGVKDGRQNMPTELSLSQNYPNPFNPSTTIRYELPIASLVTLTVFDVLGQQMSVLVNEEKDAGVHEVKFDASGLSSGVYFYRMQSGSFVQTRKLLLVR